MANYPFDIFIKVVLGSRGRAAVAVTGADPEAWSGVPLRCRVAFFKADEETLARLKANGQVLWRYVDAQGQRTEIANPNGSLDNIAGICNEKRNVAGLMPHPEDHVIRTQHPRWTRETPEKFGNGMRIFTNAVSWAKTI